jgi:UDP-N-acetylmuramoyl-L-alanyl-D-glutamate--2,6-diaminopimelate ligase
MSVMLSRVIARIAAERLLVGPADDAGAPAAPVLGVTTDSRFVRPGLLFCAVRGTTGDGHHYLEDARAAGAIAALVEVADPSVSIPQVLVANGRKAAAFAAAEFFGDPWNEVALIGVTGTNGKTTTVSILRHLLGRRGPAASIGTLGVVGADGSLIPGTEGLTTPGPAQLAAAVRALADRGVRAVAIEASSHALEQERVCAARFAAAIFTNLSRDHLDYHKTLEAYRLAKLKLVDLIRPGGVLAVNVDDSAWDGVAREGVHLVRFGTQGRGEVQAEDVAFGPSGATFRLITPSCTADVRLPLFGIYNVYNAVGAAAALWGLGWTAGEIAEGLEDLQQVPGRLERVPAATGATVLIDYAHTPDALDRALKALRPLVSGRLIVVFGAGGNRDRGKRPVMGRVAAENADLVIVTTDNPRHEDPLVIAEDIEAGVGSAPHLRILDRREAIARAMELATPRDVVLLAGKGHETYQIWGDEHRPFDERTVVAEILAMKGIGT